MQQFTLEEVWITLQYSQSCLTLPFADRLASGCSQARCQIERHRKATACCVETLQVSFDLTVYFCASYRLSSQCGLLRHLAQLGCGKFNLKFFGQAGGVILHSLCVCTATRRARPLRCARGQCFLCTVKGLSVPSHKGFLVAVLYL